MDWARILAFVTGMVDQELLARNEYLAAENRILKAQLKGQPKLSDAERATLGEIGHRLGRKALADVATIARPDTILSWYRKLVARKFNGSMARRDPGRPRISREVEQLILRIARENLSWGYDRIAGALANLGHEVSDQTVGNVLRRHGLPPAAERKRRLGEKITMATNVKSATRREVRKSTRDARLSIVFADDILDALAAWARAEGGAQAARALPSR